MIWSIKTWAEAGAGVQQGCNIVVFTNSEASPADTEIYEVRTSGIPSRKDLIDPRIDFHAQEVLYRMFKGDPGAREEASGMVTSTTSGRVIRASSGLLFGLRCNTNVGDEL